MNSTTNMVITAMAGLAVGWFASDLLKNNKAHVREKHNRQLHFQEIEQMILEHEEKMESITKELTKTKTLLHDARLEAGRWQGMPMVVAVGSGSGGGTDQSNEQSSSDDDDDDENESSPLTQFVTPKKRPTVPLIEKN
jgi:hypothetical protein